MYVLLVYIAGFLFTRYMITSSNIPDAGPNPSNLSPTWAFIWPVFWFKTIPFFIDLHRGEKRVRSKTPDE